MRLHLQMQAEIRVCCRIAAGVGRSNCCPLRLGGGGLFFANVFISEAIPPSRLGGSDGSDRGTRGL